MPRITALSVHAVNGRPAHGLKRQTFAEPLTGCDLFAGENGAGKTSRLIALVALIEGLAQVPTDPRCPYVGELPADTGVTVTLDGGASLTRDLSQGPRSKAYKDATAEAKRLIGIPPTAWDLSDFASGTDGDRGAILDAVARAGGAIQAWDQVQAQARVTEILSADMPENVDAEAWLFPMVSVRAQLTAAPDGATWLKSAEVWAEARQKVTNAAQKAARSHAEEVGAQAAPPAADGDAQADTEARSALYQEQAALKTAAQDHDRALADLTRYRQEGERLDRALATSVDEGKRLAVPLPAPDAAIPADVAARLDEARTALDAPVLPADPGKLQGLETELVAARAALDAATVKADAARDAVAKAEATVKAATQDRAEALAAEQDPCRAQILAASAVLTAEAVGSPDCVCKSCGITDPLDVAAKLAQAQKDRKAADKALAAAKARTDAATVALEAAERVVTSLDTEAAALLRVETTAHAALGKLLAQVEAATDALDSHTATVRAARQRDLESAQAAVTREQARITRETAAHATAEAARVKVLGEARDRHRALVADRKAWQHAGEPVVPTEPSPLRAAEITAELAAIQARDDARTARAQAVKAAQVAAERADAAKVEWDATRALLAAVRQARDELAAAAYQPIETAAQELLEGDQAHGLPVPYFSSPSEYGAIVDGRGRVPFAGLSESERRITAASLVYALATVARNPVRLVLLDGLEVVQEDHRGHLLSALSAAQKAGKVDNVIVTMATNEDQMQDGAILSGFRVRVVERTASADPAPVVARIAPAAVTATAGSAALAFDLDEELPF